MTDPTLFEECYRCIPPGMYEEAEMHIQEMVDVAAIRPSRRPWASAMVLVQKKDENWCFVLT